MNTHLEGIKDAPLLTGNISELEDDDDDDEVADIEEGQSNLDNEIIDLPLKAKLLQTNNFPELTADWNNNNSSSGTPGTPNGINNVCTGINSAKRVRFEEGLDDSDTETGLRRSSKSNKIPVEELLQSASDVNDYLGENIEKMNSFKGDPFNDTNFYRIMSDVATQNTTRTESLSNFELTDNELEDPYKLDSNLGRALDQDNKGSSSPNSKLFDDPLSVSQQQLIYSQQSDNLSSSNLHLDRSVSNNEDMKSQSSEINYGARKFGNLNINDQKEGEQSQSDEEEEIENEDDLRNTSLLVNREDVTDTPFKELSPEEAINNYKETIDLILKVSNSDVPDESKMILSNPVDTKDYVNFTMKNTPSLSYEDFLKRIQSKCMFGAIIYMSATYLFQILLLNRDDSKGPIKLKNKLQEVEIHRMIIATIRVATKLVEDFVHSHQYFCKVCGVSKRLLSKLEVSLILALKHDRLIITTDELASSVQILSELRSFSTQ
ncbi:Pcl8p NDAI_0F01480 [Naumovozyma dairenensis CBS 421]|uniref:Uncharacterized protein n=1 Tax=Naumovozyma dairenensis (strain ATCC 10597 / BCRC 20456 / CBS 421 / NBRC 0211 / NRRL Y-12639) TaxID=1071378 RepID=G0WCF6_NAUDC|nr:hypothetical protein NDAI_0F01480 [Naumovozyma dairenensis CBS 421]CCD25467.1 hypothetical protein NDAI_0F01480 [Naumovozyma dairenensis CBS 421]